MPGEEGKTGDGIRDTGESQPELHRRESAFGMRLASHRRDAENAENIKVGDSRPKPLDRRQ